mmetsp:Transcript_9302/g.22685  ORF Transcript_9302/g.22685 Transcript_9302/m.22685 type:complete len:86 (+) Transcript_9302:234-491(+)
MAGNTSSTAIRALLKEAINKIVQQPITTGFGPTSALTTADQARRLKDSVSSRATARASAQLYSRKYNQHHDSSYEQHKYMQNNNS